MVALRIRRQTRTSMTLRDVVMTITVGVLALALLGTSALTDLRSPERTATLGARLADDAAVRELVVTGVVDAIVEDAAARSGPLAPFVPLVGPLLTTSISTTLDTPAGRAALASALTDGLRQLTVAGPIVIDLRSAALAAAEDAPAPLDTLIRAAVAQGTVGVLVLGGDEEDGTAAAPRPLADEDVGRVGGLAPGLARTLSALLLLGALMLLLAPSARANEGAAPRRRRTVAAGGALLVAGGGTLLLLRAAPDAVTSRLVETLPDGGAGSRALPVLLDGVRDLLVPTGRLGLGLAVLGVLAIVGGLLMRPATDGPPDAPAIV